MNFEEMTVRHPRALKVAHDEGLSSGTENTNGNENMDEDEEINQAAWTSYTDVLRPKYLENCLTWRH